MGPRVAGKLDTKLESYQVNYQRKDNKLVQMNFIQLVVDFIPHQIIF